MKPRIPLYCVALLLAVPFRGLGQYCIPQTALPYAPSMPGLTLVQLNTIVRPSQDLEHYPDNNYTNTGLSTTLVKGESYPVTLGFTIDAGISPHMNLRLWVDLNHDGQLDDPGETLYTIDHVATTQNGTITIPTTAMTGATRMRVTAKMCSHGGHSIPTPCDQPPDLLGYHGEIEDYEVNIVDAVGLVERVSPIASINVIPNPVMSSSVLLIQVDEPVRSGVEILDAAGRLVGEMTGPRWFMPGETRIPLGQVLHGSPAGVYAVRLRQGGASVMHRFVVTGP